MTLPSLSRPAGRGRALVLALLTFASVLTACGGGGGDATSPPTETKDPNEVGPTGGTVTAQNDKVQLTIPAGAVSQDIKISVTPISNPTNDNRVAGGSIYEFGPDGTQFAQPVTLKLAYNPDDLPAGTDMGALKIAKYLDGEWKEVDNIAVDSVGHFVTGQIHSFSKYGVKADPCALMAHTVGSTTSGQITTGSCLYPNPSNPDNPKYSDYYNISLASDAVLKVNGSGISGTYGVKEYTPGGNDGLVWAYSDTGVPLQVAMKAGVYQIFFSGADTTVTGDYSFTSSLAGNLAPVCTEEFVGMMPGTGATATLGANSCDITLKYANPAKYNGEKSKADYYLVKLPGGKSYTFTAGIQTAGTNIALTVYAGGKVWLDAGGADHNPKVVTYTPSGPFEWATIEVSASTISDEWNAPLGSYSLSVSN